MSGNVYTFNNRANELHGTRLQPKYNAERIRRQIAVILIHGESISSHHEIPSKPNLLWLCSTFRPESNKPKRWKEGRFFFFLLLLLQKLVPNTAGYAMLIIPTLFPVSTWITAMTGRPSEAAVNQNSAPFPLQGQPGLANAYSSSVTETQIN